LAGEDYGAVFDWAVDPAQKLDQPKPPQNGDFCRILPPPTSYEEDREEDLYGPAHEPGDVKLQLYTPPRQLNVHITLINPNRRGEENQVYRYDALAAGEVFAGVIVATEDIDLAPLQKLLKLSPDLFIGGAHTSGYGHAQLEAVDVRDDWREYGPGNGIHNGVVIVTLLSDTVVRGASGQIDGDIHTALAALPGIGPLKALRKYQQLGLVGGFNRKWGLPLVQDWAVKAGSVYVYAAQGVDVDELRQAVAKGIGERRAEGFGRVAVNWHTYPVLQREKPPALDLPAATLSADSKEQARQMAGRRLELLLTSQLTKFVSAVEIVSQPQNAQLSRVRNAVQRALATGDLQPIVDHLDDLKGAREQFERARVERTPMLQWIKDRVGSQDVETRLLGQVRMPRIAGETAELTLQLKIKYTARLIDGVMKKAIKQNQ
jgi:CRISPR-associated protein Csx10